MENYLGKKETMNGTKNAAAMRSHCEAERRRRERINGHLATLRNILPSTKKMDKATLLEEAINHVKILKEQAKEATKGLVIPTDSEELTIEPYYNNDNNMQQHQNEVIRFRVSLCCDYKPELIKDIRNSIMSLKFTITKAEIATLGSRMKNVFIITGLKQYIGDVDEEKFARSIRQSLRTVIDKITASEEYSPRTLFPIKKLRTSILDDSNSSVKSIFVGSEMEIL